MDTIALNAASVVARTAEQGGGTFVAKTLEPFAPKDGFAVAIGGVEVKADQFDTATAMWLMHAVAGEFNTVLVGTWLHDGIVFIDAVSWFMADQREQAIAAGRAHDQQAIFDFATGESIDL